MGQPVDGRTDQYSLAGVLYEMLAGEPPFTGPTAQAVVARRLAEPVRPLRPVRSTVPAGTEAAILRALERIPADRFPDISTFAAALRHPGERPEPLTPRRTRRIAAVVAGLLLVLLGVAGGGSSRRGAAPRRRGIPRSWPSTAAVLRGYDQRTADGVRDAISALEAAVAPRLHLRRGVVRAGERPMSAPTSAGSSSAPSGTRDFGARWPRPTAASPATARPPTRG